MRNTVTTTVLVAGGEALLRRALMTYIDGEDDLVVSDDVDPAPHRDVRSWTDLDGQYRSARPDVVVLGTSASREQHAGVAALIALDPSAKVLVIGPSTASRATVEAVREGARGVTFTDVEPQDFLDAIRCVSRGGYALPHRAARHLAEFVQTIPPFLLRDPPPDSAHMLSRREVAVVRALGKGRTNSQIALALNLSEATVKSHLSRVMAKWDARDRTQVVLHAARRGVIVIDETLAP